MADKKQTDKVVTEKEKIDKTKPGWSNTLPGTPAATPVVTGNPIKSVS